MLANTVTELVTDELRHEYKATLLQIKKHLTNDQQEELCFYYTAGLTTAETTGILKLFRSLENLRKISWVSLKKVYMQYRDWILPKY